jgi:serine/threonine protein kinase
MKICSVCQRCYDDDAKFCVQKNHSRLVAARDGTREAATGYRLNFLLQRDGITEVYEAVQIETNKSVLIRFISPQFYFDTLNLRETFVHEAQTVAALHHENIVGIDESGVLENGELYSVTENVDGQTLRQYFDERDSFSENDAILIVRQIADALEAAHRVGISHRAVNPSNVIISFDEENRLTAKLFNFDFGGVIEQLVTSAEWFSNSNNEEWRLEMFKYFSPEQCARETVDARSDIYSLGVLFYELLNGHPPFTDETVQGLTELHLNAQPQEIENLRFDIKELLNHTLALSLKKSPFARPQTVARFAHNLTHVEHLTSQSLSPLEKFLQTVKEDNKPFAPPKPKTQPTAPIFNDFVDKETSLPERETRKAAAPTSRLFAAAFLTEEKAAEETIREEIIPPQEMKETVVNSTENFRFAAPETIKPATSELPEQPFIEKVEEEKAESSDFIESNETNADSEEVLTAPRRIENTLAGFEAHGARRSRFPAAAVGLLVVLVIALVGALFLPSVLQNTGGNSLNAALSTKESVTETEPEESPTAVETSDKRVATKGKQKNLPKQEAQAAKEAAEPAKQSRPTERKPSQAKTAFRFNGNLTPEAQEELSSSLNNWMEATNEGDVNRQMNFYAPKLNAYYLTRNVSPEVVRAEKRRVFAQAEDINIEAAKPDIQVSRDGRNAKMRFRKKYAFKDGQRTRKGEVLQELHWVKSGKNWKIVSERDLRVLNQ